MTKNDAIADAKLGCEVYHPVSGGTIVQKCKVNHNLIGLSKLEYYLDFSGDCSPKDGWESEYLGAR